ncbi:MAG TPA: hypothetical protein VFS07_04555 [Gemmatimonadales bacterium]|jgi:hypothetical protein|nr:hypothetical protein [Gemmatimonadales bacterium]
MQMRVGKWALAAAALILTAAPLGAQQAPTVTVGGVGYAQWNYNLSGTQHLNAFDVTRTYININAKFSGGVSTRATSDIYRNADGSLAYRLKYGYVAYQPEGRPTTFKLGLVQTPWVSREEDLWEYRMQGPIALDRNKIMTSADFGLSADTRIGDRLELNAAVVNGEGYSKSEGDQRKDFQLRASYRLASSDDTGPYGGLRVSGYAGLGRPTGGGVRDRFIGMLSYRTRQYTVAAEYVSTADSSTATPTPKTTGSLVSAFALYHLPSSKVTLLGRVDLYDPNTDASDDKSTRVIGGASYQLSPNLRLLADVDLLSHEAGDPEVAVDPRQQFLFQAQFSF